MGRKKREDLTLKPFCYYCDKEFETVLILLKHQKNRHFSCKDCRRKFSKASSIVTHCMTKHHITLSKVANAKKGRDSITMNIYGMVGIPDDIIDQRLHQKKVQMLAKLEEEKSHE